jgi:adenylate kinase
VIAVLLGPPGSGKGTQAKRLAPKLRALHLSSGDILRAEKAAGTDLGKKATGYMDRGELVPDSLIIEMMLGRMTRERGKSIILDGFPRTLDQAEALDEGLARNGLTIHKVVNIDVPDAEVERRMTGRRSCPTCGAVYHVEFTPPRTAGKCDKDAVDLIQRNDDKPEVVQKRLVTYHRQTQPLVDYYHKHGLLKDVDGTQAPEMVEAKVQAALA